MGMPGNKKSGPVFKDLLFYTWCIAAGIAADVDHIHLYIFALPGLLQGKAAPDVIAVNIVLNAFKVPEISHVLFELSIGEIAAVQDLVALYKMLENRFVEIGMCF